MLKADQIPPEVEAAFLATLQRQGGATMAEALAAGLSAWPGMHTGWQCIGCGDDAQIILPLPQEMSDD